MQAQNINEVIAHLTTIIEWAREHNSRIGYFPALYRKVTQEVKRGIERGDFEDGERMERLDVLFANRYLEAFDQFQRGETPTRSWQFAFDAAGQWWPIVLQHLLLGINAHINYDLVLALVDVLDDEWPRLDSVGRARRPAAGRGSPPERAERPGSWVDADAREAGGLFDPEREVRVLHGHARRALHQVVEGGNGHHHAGAGVDPGGEVDGVRAEGGLRGRAPLAHDHERLVRVERPHRLEGVLEVRIVPDRRAQPAVLELAPRREEGTA